MEANYSESRKYSHSFCLLVFLLGEILTTLIFLGFYLLNGKYLVMSRISYRKIESSLSDYEKKIAKQAQHLKKQEDYILTQNRTIDTQKTQLKERDYRLLANGRFIEKQLSQITKQNDYIVALSKAKKTSDGDINLYADSSQRLLKELIKKDFPQIANPDLDDWTKVNLLRKWAYRNIDWGSGETLIDPRSKLNLHGLPPQVIFANFISDKRGTFCGGASVSLMKLYRMFGFPSYAYGMGDPTGFSHTITLVSINHRGRIIYAVEDAALNLTYADSKGNPLDFFEMLRLLKKGKREQIEVLEGKVKSRELIVASRELMETFRDLIVPEASLGQRLPDGRIKCKILVNLDVVKEKFGDQIFSFLKKYRQPPDPVYLYLHPTLFDGLGNTDSLSQRTRQIIQSKTVTTSHQKRIQ